MYGRHAPIIVIIYGDSDVSLRVLEEGNDVGTTTRDLDSIGIFGDDSKGSFLSRNSVADTGTSSLAISRERFTRLNNWK